MVYIGWVGPEWTKKENQQQPCFYQVWVIFPILYEYITAKEKEKSKLNTSLSEAWKKNRKVEVLYNISHTWIGWRDIEIDPWSNGLVRSFLLYITFWWIVLFFLISWVGVFFLVIFSVELLVSFLYLVCLSAAAVKSVRGTKSVVDGFGFTWVTICFSIAT